MTAPDCRLHAALSASERTDEVEAMARALEPFAVAADAYDPDDGDGHYAAWGSSPLIGELRTARASLATYRARHPRPDTPPALPHREDTGPGGVAFKYSDNLADATQKNDLAHFAAVTCWRLEAMKIRAKAANRRADAAEAALATARREAEERATERAFETCKEIVRTWVELWSADALIREKKAGESIQRRIEAAQQRTWAPEREQGEGADHG